MRFSRSDFIPASHSGIDPGLVSSRRSGYGRRERTTVGRIGRDTRAPLVFRIIFGAVALLALPMTGPMTGAAAFEATELATLKAGGACPRCDLSGADLKGMDLSGRDLQGADLSSAQLQGADLTRANLRSVNLEKAELAEANLRKAILDGARLTGADLARADLSGATWVDGKRVCAEGSLGRCN